ncbi:MAG TPA: hypothetical protein VNM22_04125 [Candidatus Limnocylindrales bacterium]|nr:hypothetical protein [Candidatus Limnocylindrales bacterium]
MNRRQYGFLVILVILSSFAGGAIASQERRHVANPIQQIQKIIASEDFLLLDEAGKVHGRWGTLENDQPGLFLKDFNDKVRVIIILSEAGSPSLAFIDATGKTRMRISLSDEGDPSLALMDKDGEVFWATPEIQK